MRVFHGVLALVLGGFAAVQYNDPDAWVWMVLYGLPALFAGLAALEPTLLSRRTVRLPLLLCLALAVALTVYVWPDAEAFWRLEVWWGDEGAREGLGMMIVTVSLAIVTVNALRTRPRHR